MHSSRDAGRRQQEVDGLVEMFERTQAVVRETSASRPNEKELTMSGAWRYMLNNSVLNIDASSGLAAQPAASSFITC
jgi:hypothetical protein